MGYDEFVRTVAELVAGLQVPFSLGMPLGAAAEPWHRLFMLAGFGWTDAATLEEVFLQKVS